MLEYNFTNDDAPNVYIDMASEELETYVMFCREVGKNGIFNMRNGNVYVLDVATNNLSLAGVELKEPCCKFFTPSQESVNLNGGIPAKGFHLSRLYTQQSHCSNPELPSSVCGLARMQPMCPGFQADETEILGKSLLEDETVAVGFIVRVDHGMENAWIEIDGERTEVFSGARARTDALRKLESFGGTPQEFNQINSKKSFISSLVG